MITADTVALAAITTISNVDIVLVSVLSGSYLLSGSFNRLETVGNTVEAVGNLVEAVCNPVEAVCNPVEAVCNPVDAVGNLVDEVCIPFEAVDTKGETEV